MAVEVTEGATIRHDGVLYKAGQIIQNIDTEAKAELVKLGVVKDLDSDVATASNQAEADAATLAASAKVQAEADAATIADQAKAAVQQDLADAEQMANTPGKKVGVVAAASGQPSAEEVAAATANV